MMKMTPQFPPNMKKIWKIFTVSNVIYLMQVFKTCKFMSKSIQNALNVPKFLTHQLR